MWFFLWCWMCMCGFVMVFFVVYFVFKFFCWFFYVFLLGMVNFFLFVLVGGFYLGCCVLMDGWMGYLCGDWWLVEGLLLGVGIGGFDFFSELVLFFYYWICFLFCLCVCIWSVGIVCGLVLSFVSYGCDC